MNSPPTGSNVYLGFEAQEPTLTVHQGRPVRRSKVEVPVRPTVESAARETRTADLPEVHASDEPCAEQPS